MNRAVLVVAAGVMLASLGMSSSAGADKIDPKQAKAQYTDMVTGYQSCGAPTLTHRPSLAFPACAPTRSSTINPADEFTFGQKFGRPDGWMNAQLKVVAGDIRTSIKSKSIFKNGAAYSGTDLQGTAIVRVTDNGCGGAFDVDCTIVDIPFPLGLVCFNGFCKAASQTVNAGLPGTVPENDRANIEIGQISIVEPDGDTFARSGLFVQ